MHKIVPFNTLEGKIITKLEITNDYCITFNTNDEEYQMYHEQECCENIQIEDISGHIEDLLNTPIISAIESTSRGLNPDPDDPDDMDQRLDPNDIDRGCGLWTFYRLVTFAGSVVIRWLGNTPNGYYSERVNLYQVVKEE